MNIVADQIGSPAYTHDLARLISNMIVADKYDIYHATNEGGDCRCHEFACEIFRLSKDFLMKNPFDNIDD